MLCDQYGGESESGLKPAGASDNWRCLAVESLSQVEGGTARRIEEVELDVDTYPEPVPPTPSPNPKSAKL